MPYWISEFMEINYKRQHNESFMVLEVAEASSGYEERMIEENEIPALLKYTKVNLNGVQQYNYCISRKENLEDFVEARDLTLEVFRRLILNIQLAYEEIERYLIDENHIFLSKETVFLEKSNDSFKVSLCYYPHDMGGVQQQFRELIEYFLKLVPNDNRKLAEYIYNAYDLCLKDDFTFDEILDSLQEEQDNETFVEKIDPYAMEGNQESLELHNDYIPQGDSLSEMYDLYDNEKTGKFGNFFDSVKSFLNMRIQFKDDVESSYEDFIVEPDYELEEKTILLTDVKPTGKLVYDGQKQEDDFLVNKDVFRIGTGKNNDAILKERTVSSNHAKIIRDGDDFFISDLNSTNQTYLNNEPLVYKIPRKLKIMDKISFANVNYIFQ
ncbi:FHA domain-containing protein [Pseudobutyrivibrio xylanivorans DSM 14809]|uniref:FHA domain-containing protein n=2 Tax=Pseudobutyrivibrio xylanivorans TaxID=185007 RepID=A0A1M6H6G4_PSEXY|nr:FHA domain-containing protein [Pseudobutyrivibrio xylanivorans DSM 14809]